MVCSDIEQYIQPFLNDELTDNDLREFLYHVQNCPVCYEEMETSYLLKEAFDRLEDGRAFDLDAELTEKIATMKRIAHVHEMFSILRRVCLVSAGVCIAIQIIALYLTVW